MLNSKVIIYGIPGWGFNGDIFQEFKTNDFHIVGLNYFNEKNFSIEAVAHIFSEFISENSIVLGWSFGGLIAIKIALLFPNKVKKLILLSSQPKFLSHSPKQGISYKDADNFINKLQINFEEQLLNFIKLVNYPNIKSQHKQSLNQHLVDQSQENLINQLKIFFKTDMINVYNTIQCEILHIINGEDLVIVQDENYLKQLNQNIKAVKIEKTGHAGFLTHTKDYLDIIKGFVQNE